MSRTAITDSSGQTVYVERAANGREQRTYPIGYHWGTWEVASEPFLDKHGKRAQRCRCTRCGSTCDKPPSAIYARTNSTCFRCNVRAQRELGTLSASKRGPVIPYPR